MYIHLEIVGDIQDRVRTLPVLRGPTQHQAVGGVGALVATTLATPR